MSGVEERLAKIVADRKNLMAANVAARTQKQLDEICTFFENNPERFSMRWKSEQLTPKTIATLSELGFGVHVHNEISSIVVNWSK